MRYLLGLFFPWLTFFTMGKIIPGILCLILQITLIGWIPAVIWCFITINSYHDMKSLEKKIVNSYEKNR